MDQAKFKVALKKLKKKRKVSEDTKEQNTLDGIIESMES